MKHMLIAQSGGPSAAINATVAGVVERCLTSDKVDRIYGAVNGIKGVLNGNYVDLTEILSSPEQLRLLCSTPAAALGSCRLKLNNADEGQLGQIVDALLSREIGYFVYIGGNDSMDTVYQLSAYIKKHNIQGLSVMGAPKTIDNDLPMTDHCPGFGSAAKYIAATFAEIVRDCEVYDIPAVTIVEVMGRNAGWLTAASALSRENGGTGPQLIYLCERAFDTEQFIRDVKDCLAKRNAVVVAVSEGLKNADGSYLSESKGRGVDVFGHAALSGTAKVLEGLVKEKIGCKVRSIELNLMQRCASHLASANDLSESKMLGMTAADRALNGVSGEMAIVERLSSAPYRVRYGTTDIALVANLEKKVPDSCIHPQGNDVTEQMLEYLRPLVHGEVQVPMCGGVPVHLELYTQGK
ncbi:MAG: 6-phosphofructokinase [Negativibacillus sp.]|nr:6-phosphofructokinase [Negativibacillus sp.]